MNIFQYQGQEEDHYTNILMNIISLNNCEIAQFFLYELLPRESQSFSFQNCAVSLRKKQCPREQKENEYIIGVAPYQKALNESNELEFNVNSIPDAWLCGENFNILFEFKIRGTLDESQMDAHKKLLGANAKVIRLQWEEVIIALRKVGERSTTVSKFLVDQFIEVSQNFKDKRKASGMPKEVISNVKNDQRDEVYFIITGSRDIGFYTVDLVQNGEAMRVNNKLKGIMAARRWIAQFVLEHNDILRITFNELETIVTDYCVVPGRPEKKNQWNQWRIGTMVK